MATINELKSKVNNINLLGRQNLATKRVYVDKSATTYDIIRKIAEIKGGTLYESIEYKPDNTIVLKDFTGKEHIMECSYLGHLLRYVLFDGEIIEMAYDMANERLRKVGDTDVDLVFAPIYGVEPLDYTITFTVDNEEYEKVLVKRGNLVRSPVTVPKSSIPSNASFSHWSDGIAPFREAYPPTESASYAAVFNTVIDDFYNYNGIDRKAYSEFIMRRNGDRCWVYVAKPGTFDVSDLPTSPDGKIATHFTCEPDEYYQIVATEAVGDKVTNPNLIMKCAIPDSKVETKMAGFSTHLVFNDDDYCYTNARYTGVTGNWIYFGGENV